MRSTQFFIPYGGFPLITLLLGMLHCSRLQALKAIESLTCVINFLFREFCLSLLFKFKIEPSVSLSCLMPSTFIIMRIIIGIIRTTCFENTILMVELEGKLLYSSWSLSAHNFPNSGYFHKIFRTYLQKGLVVYFHTKTFLPQLVFFFEL